MRELVAVFLAATILSLIFDPEGTGKALGSIARQFQSGLNSEAAP